MQFTHFVGINISKSYLDWNTIHQTQSIAKQHITNEQESIRVYLKALLADLQVSLEQILFTMEYTGKYNFPLLEVLEELKAHIWQVSPFHLNRSMGLQRGKNDPVDAHRIALFAMRHQDEFRPHQAMRSVLSQIKSLFSLRRVLVKSCKSLKMQLTDLEFIEKDIQKKIQAHLQEVLMDLKQKNQQLEQQMTQIIHNDQVLSRLFIIITSVIGVGTIVAIKILLVTNEFKRLQEPKKLACQAGIAPFEYQSGSSIKKAARISNMADHELKNLLHLAALAAIRTEGELKDYYQRKKAQHKPTMSIINAVRNKIIHRICACVKTDRVYQKDYQHPLEAA